MRYQTINGRSKYKIISLRLSSYLCFAFLGNTLSNTFSPTITITARIFRAPRYKMVVDFSRIALAGMSEKKKKKND